MKSFLFSLPIFVFAMHAEARPSTFRMTCTQTQALVEAHGSIALNYAYSEKAGPLYDRYYSSTAYCNGSDRKSEASVPTLDNDSCDIGFTCADPLPNN